MMKPLRENPRIFAKKFWHVDWNPDTMFMWNGTSATLTHAEEPPHGTENTPLGTSVQYTCGATTDHTAAQPPTTPYHMTIDHKSTLSIIKQALPGTRMGFSTSPRKGGRSFWAIKMEATPERVEALEKLIADDKLPHWSLFFSKDRATTGVHVICNDDGTL